MAARHARASEGMTVSSANRAEAERGESSDCAGRNGGLEREDLKRSGILPGSVFRLGPWRGEPFTLFSYLLLNVVAKACQKHHAYGEQAERQHHCLDCWNPQGTNANCHRSYQANHGARSQDGDIKCQ